MAMLPHESCLYCAVCAEKCKSGLTRAWSLSVFTLAVVPKTFRRERRITQARGACLPISGYWGGDNGASKTYRRGIVNTLIFLLLESAAVTLLLGKSHLNQLI